MDTDQKHKSHSALLFICVSGAPPVARLSSWRPWRLRQVLILLSGRRFFCRWGLGPITGWPPRDAGAGLAGGHCDLSYATQWSGVRRKRGEDSVCRGHAGHHGLLRHGRSDHRERVAGGGGPKGDRLRQSRAAADLGLRTPVPTRHPEGDLPTEGSREHEHVSCARGPSGRYRSFGMTVCHVHGPKWRDRYSFLSRNGRGRPPVRLVKLFRARRFGRKWGAFLPI